MLWFTVVSRFCGRAQIIDNKLELPCQCILRPIYRESMISCVGRKKEERSNFVNKETVTS